MKTAISLPDELFKEAERYAEKHGLSRSELIANALRDFMKSRSDEEIIAAFNEVYKDETNAVDPVLDRLQWEAAKKNPW